jgi:hypothetical protein
VNSPSDNPAAAATWRELERRFAAAVEQLEESDRQIVLLRHFEHLSTAEAADLEEVFNAYPKIQYVVVEAGDDRASYNGTAFNAQTTGVVRSLSISSKLLPRELARDLAKYLYTFLAIDRHLYRVEVGATPLFQYEPMDGATLGFSTTKIVQTGTGVIYGVIYRRSGSMRFEVLD